MSVLSVVLYIIGAVVGLWLGIHSVKDTLTFNSYSSNKMLEGGKEKSKEQAKIFNMGPAQDPMYYNAGSSNVINTNNTTINNNNSSTTMSGPVQIPDMRGIDYNNANNVNISIPTAIEGEGSMPENQGININSVVGEAGVVTMNAPSGRINNIMSKQIEGPIQQQGVINNLTKDSNQNVQQLGNNITNQIENSKIITYRDASERHFSREKGNMKPLQLSKGNLIGGTKRFYLPDNQMIEGNSSENEEENNNEVQVQVPSKKIIDFNTAKLNVTNKKYTVVPEDATKILSLEQAYSDSRNTDLGMKQLVKLSEVYRANNIMNLAGDTNYRNVINQVIQENSTIENPEHIMWIADRAINKTNGKRIDREKRAGFMTNKPNVQRNLQAENMNFLNNMIINDSNISGKFSNFESKEYRSQKLQQAKENILKRGNMTLEEKEAEYEKIKEQILENPEEAVEILGENGVEELKGHMNEEKRKVYEDNIEKQEKIADANFKKQHEEYKDSSSEVVRKERTKEEMKEAISEAVKELYQEMKKADDKNNLRRSSFEEYKERMKNQENMSANNMLQPAVNSNVYIPRSVQEQIARNLNR